MLEALSFAPRPTRVRLGAIDNLNIDNAFVPKDARAIQRCRGKRNLLFRQNAPAESPAELREFCRQKNRVDNLPPSQLWIDEPNVIIEDEIAVPFGSDVPFHVLRDFIIAGMKYFGRARFLKIVIDVTHDQTKQRLKLLKVSVAGHTFNIRSEWVNAGIPVMTGAISRNQWSRITLREILRQDVLGHHRISNRGSY